MKIRGSSIIIFLTLSLFIMFFTVSCKKYPDGPIFNFTSKYNRLEKAYWVLDYLEIGGIDSTSDFLAATDSGYVFESMEFLNRIKEYLPLITNHLLINQPFILLGALLIEKGNWQFKLHLIQDPFLRKAILLDLYGLMRELNIEL
ncbi:MAG: hypothetical protein IPP32_14315 [Bacteroidetes bacterium]|nr:hypothetical protein [Bacteroidota bacterium]